jgi:hypothetical protein
MRSILVTFFRLYDVWRAAQHEDNGAAYCGCTQRNEFPRSQLTAYKDQRTAITATGVGSKPRLRKPDSLEALINQHMYNGRYGALTMIMMGRRVV